MTPVHIQDDRHNGKSVNLFSLTLTLLASGCAFDGAMTEQQFNARKQAVENQYARATELYKQKMAPIASYIVNVCGPMADKEYLDCINAKRTEIKILSIYPENAACREQRLALEQQLISKQIDRKEFRAKLEDIKNRHNAERLQQDVKSGIYSGQY